MSENEYAKANIKKWGLAVHNEGWVYVPTLLITSQRELGITPQELNVILIILRRWWTKGNLAFPSMSEIAQLMGRDISTTRKIVKSLEDKKLLKRIYRKSENNKKKNLNNKYDFTGLIKRLTEIAERANPAPF